VSRDLRDDIDTLRYNLIVLGNSDSFASRDLGWFAFREINSRSEYNISLILYNNELVI